jgi:hypothetical protein
MAIVGSKCEELFRKKGRQNAAPVNRSGHQFQSAQRQGPGDLPTLVVKRRWRGVVTGRSMQAAQIPPMQSQPRKRG